MLNCLKFVSLLRFLIAYPNSFVLSKTNKTKIRHSITRYNTRHNTIQQERYKTYKIRHTIQCTIRKDMPQNNMIQGWGDAGVMSYSKDAHTLVWYDTI